MTRDGHGCYRTGFQKPQRIGAGAMLKTGELPSANLGIEKELILSRLRGSLKAGKIQRIGKGKPGSPFQYLAL